MQATSSRKADGPVVLGAVLVIVGLAAIGLQALGIDALERVRQAGWPLFVILPGVALLTAAFIVAPPQGVAFAIPGAIVTTTGLVLLYQDATGHWESWAYAWALVGPGAAGLGLLLYGTVFRHRQLARQGARLVAVAAVLFGLGFWFFETLFQSGRVPIDLGELWPLGLIGLGAVIVLGSLLSRPQVTGPSGTAGTEPAAAGTKGVS